MYTAIRTILAGVVFLLAAGAAERSVAPTFLFRHLPNIAAHESSVTTESCRYKPVFGEGDSETRIVGGVARFGEVTIDPGGACALFRHDAEEQVYIVTEGSPLVIYDGARHPAEPLDYMYLPPGVEHGLANASDKTARVLIMGWKIPDGAEVQIPDELLRDNIENVPLEVVGNHPPSSKFRLLMGTTESKRDRIAAAHVLTSLFVMEFTPGGTNFPHHHPNEEEFYLLMEGKGEMVAGGGMDGIEGRHPAKAGDAYFFRLNCTVGFYASPDAGAPRARILAARSKYPR